MSRYHAYLRNAAALVGQYDGAVPLAIFLKQYFSGQKKFGSNDRKQIAALCHQYYRMGHWLKEKPVEEKLLLADFLCRTQVSDLIRNLKPDWVDFSYLLFDQKVKALRLNWDQTVHTPWLHLIQNETDGNHYVQSLFRQPYLYLRVRPGKKDPVLKKMELANIPAEWIMDDCIRLPNGTRMDEVLDINRDVVVQDLSSQQCGKVIQQVIPDLNGDVWDACAASGGKSILLNDLFGNRIKLVVSDIRPAILHNLRQRLRQAGIHQYKSILADLTAGVPEELGSLMAQAVLVDAPCTGSGTWARTPEQHYFFNPKNLAAFTQRQLSICNMVIPRIISGGYILYITCSVFEMENTAVVEQLERVHHLKRLTCQVLDGTREGADSMFIAILQKP